MKWKIGFKDGSGNGHKGIHVNDKYKYVGEWDNNGASITDEHEDVIVRGGECDALDWGVLDEADAYLISKAPELLKCAKNIISYSELRETDRSKLRILVNNIEKKYKNAKS
jgi:hypothetical protein